MPRVLRGLAGSSRFPAAYWTSTYRPVPHPGFGKGLQLRDQPDSLTADQAFDCLDVTFSQRGAVRSRDGYAAFTAAALTNAPDSMSPFYTSSGTKQLMVGNGNRLAALSTAGAVVASSAAPTANPHYFARVATPTTELLYIANGTDTVRTWDGANYAVPVYTGTTPTGKFLAVTGADNRLACACTATNPSRVLFSDPGLPTTFGANNYVDLHPGDGEAITGMVAWGNQLFVFKSSSYYVFSGTSTDSAGLPVFNYHAVVTGCGLVSSRALVAGRDAVYFMDRKGVYKTTGPTPPVPVSGNLDPLFTGDLSDLYSGSAISQGNITNAAMTWHEERVYVSAPTLQSYNDRMFVLDTRYGWWSVYSIPASCLASFRVTNQPELVFGYATGTKDVGRHSAAYSTDAGGLISQAFWKGGWWDAGSPDVKTIREAKMWGTGRLQMGYAHDFQTSPSMLSTIDFTTGADVWGSSAWGAGNWAGGRVLVPEPVRHASRGTVFSLQAFSYQGNPWTLERVVAHIREQEIGSTVQEVDA